MTANISSKSRVLPKAFTEKGLYMLATVLKSRRGISAVSKMIKQVKPVLSFLQAKQHREMYNCIEIAVGGGNRREMSVID